MPLRRGVAKNRTGGCWYAMRGDERVARKQGEGFRRRSDLILAWSSACENCVCFTPIEARDTYLPLPFAATVHGVEWVGKRVGEWVQSSPPGALVVRKSEHAMPVPHTCSRAILSVSCSVDPLLSDGSCRYPIYCSLSMRGLNPDSPGINTPTGSVLSQIQRNHDHILHYAA